MGLDHSRWCCRVRRGEIRLVSLDPARGAEPNKTRPAVLVSNDGANTTAERLGRGVITVVPVTSNVTHIYPFQVLLTAAATGLSADSKAQAEQVRSIDVQRVGSLVGSLDGPLRTELDEALRLHLGL